MQPTLLARPFHRDGWIFEGYVAKDEASPYSGGRTLSWLKVKQKEYRVEERSWSLSAR